MSKPRVGINGFGRIGRCIFRSNLVSDLIDIVAINDLSTCETAVHLLKYDSAYGTIKDNVKVIGEDDFSVNDIKVKNFTVRNPEEIPWKDAGVDIVLECTGFFCDYEGAARHLKGGAKKVIISAPAKNGVEKTIVMGVNEETYDPAKHDVVSNASCTTNCLAPLAKIIDENFGIVKGLMTTVHSYTGDQQLLDSSHKDLRRARSAALSMIPTSTGAAKAIGEVLPHLKGKMHGLAVRVPTPTVSLVDLVCELNKSTTVEEVLKKASEDKMKGILEYCDKELVSIDFKHNPNSSIIDGLCTCMIGEKMLKVLSWYDNEWAYSTRMVELSEYIGKRL